MARKSGRKFRRKAIHRGVASTNRHFITKMQKRRRHKFKSHSHRLALLKKYFIKSEIKTEKLNQKNKIPEYRFSTDIPDNYDETYICTLPINPDSIYTYWEFASDDLIEKIDKPETDVKLNVRLRKTTPLETDLLKFPEKCLTDYPEISDKDTVPVSFEHPIVEISNEINKPIGDMVIQAPEKGDSYVIDFVKSTDTENEIIIASQEIFSNISPARDAIFESTGESIDANEYFADEEEKNKGEKSKLQQDRLSLEDCTDNFKHYLGSASYEI